MPLGVECAAEQQRRRLRQVLHCAAALPAHRDALVKAGRHADPFERLAALPVLERSHIQARPEAFRNPSRPSIAIHTSGSTGTPLTYHLDRLARTRRLVQYARFFSLHGWRPWHRALSLKVLPDSSERVGAGWLDRSLLVRRRVVSVLAPLEEQLGALRGTDPEILHGLPSALDLLADHLEGFPWRPRRLRTIFSCSESLEPEVKAGLEARLGAVVVDHYGAAEGLIAWQCRARDDYHVNWQSLLVEILDEDGRPVEPGDPGRVVITTLDNLAMPLLRYAIGDQAVAAASASCACGWSGPRLERVLGRTVQIFELPEGPVSPWAAVSRMREIPLLLRFQLVQRGPDRVEARVQWARPGAGSPGRVVALLRETLGAALRVEVVETREFLRLPSGKLAPALRAMDEVPGAG